MAERHVVVVGCGAIGGFAVMHLARLGVSRLTLVDHDELAPENLYRHVLGAHYLGLNKAVALEQALRNAFPGITVESVPYECTEWLYHGDPADVVLLATGEPTIELGMSDAFGVTMPRVHAWLEPLGLGAHTFTAGVPGEGGCFRCLFRDVHEGLYNTASFAAPGQVFTRQHGGCGGVYTPFSALDADRCALMAVEQIAGVLSGKHGEQNLTSWMGSPAPFIDAGFALSERGQVFRPYERSSEAVGKRCAACSHRVA